MALPERQQLRYWGVAAAVFFVLLWYLGDVILPFVLGGAIAYFLDPAADRLEAWGLSRAMSTALIMLGVALIVILAMLLIIPLVVDQATALIEVAPELLNNLQKFVAERFPDLTETNSLLRRSLQSLGDAIQARGGELLNQVVNSAMSLISILMLLFIVPIVAFYLLLDWDKMVAQIDRLLPRDHAPVIRRLAHEIDGTLSSFVRGQGTVCLIMAGFYAVTLMLVGLQFGLVIGLFSGLLAFIPYISSILGGVVAIGLAVFQFWGDWLMIGLVAVIYIGGQIVEGNFITPKLVGDSVGLHPVWLILALTAFGSVFGFVGMLIAVPVAASIGVLARFGVEQYMAGRLYRGLEAREDD
ncbi:MULTISPECIES: AI-2E family transporter [Actibacterium]|uniref:Putative PurR-regulated permease PerM n=1 Tax=Actibacterium naphthalenivorans TaxID=1614693 RepID=A0A840C4M8_9RHOB|nr:MULTISPECIES: AI-2E family transporter [Actibacterium]ALG91773.1 membrane protein [Actibacterium sp. EMB200-NS6]MBB4020881.1 putative PurR-regulated permease PerM [Actibacterium naphthalenivorans]